MTCFFFSPSLYSIILIMLFKKQAILILPPHRSPLLLKFGCPPEIDVFDVSDDLEQKKFGSDARSDIQAPPLHLLKFGRPLKSIFSMFQVILSKKKKMVQKIFRLWKLEIICMYIFFSLSKANLTLCLPQVLLTWCPNPAGQFILHF